jgi:hypothetical protein
VLVIWSSSFVWLVIGLASPFCILPLSSIFLELVPYISSHVVQNDYCSKSCHFMCSVSCWIDYQLLQTSKFRPGQTTVFIWQVTAGNFWHRCLPVCMVL